MRRLLAPRWLVGHVLVLALAVLFARLGLWQWHRAVATHSAQSLGYALQWPLFALFGIAVWVRMCRDAVRLEDAPPRRRAPSRRPAPPVAPAVPVTDEEDPDLAAYNRYLARLNEGRERARPGRPAAERGTPQARPGRAAAERGTP